MLDIYIKDDKNGIFLNELIQNDWQTFALQSKTIQKELIKAIMQISSNSDLKFRPKYATNASIISKWHSFTEELKFKNRFIPVAAPDKNLFIQFGELLG